jgi:KDO2-lipid IV(A) lauroyltransferase
MTGAPRRRPGGVLLATLLRLLAGALGHRSWAAAQRWGRRLGALAWALSRRDRRRAVAHAAVAFPASSAAEHVALARASFLHLGTTLGEALHLLRQDCDAVARHVRVEGWENVEKARAQGRPVLVVTGHCGNWELLAATIACRGLGLAVVARRLDEPLVDRLLVALRARFGVQTIARGTPGAVRDLLRLMRRAGALAITIDQDTKVDGVWVPFFGRPAFTPVGAVELARRLRAAAIPAFIERLDDGSHLARFQPAPDLPDDDLAATALLTREIELQVRRVPEQWVWMHRRWRRQPPEAA